MNNSRARKEEFLLLGVSKTSLLENIPVRESGNRQSKTTDRRILETAEESVTGGRSTKRVIPQTLSPAYPEKLRSTHYRPDFTGEAT